ncbi:hypothetical protein GIB67_014416 [Kingdonia uniflora]|uniref:Uncharacterized protein n=1 Tax=Kingdonia uniflora TaxID=39325 RepID=A0A7J7LYV7_9MAGN|nr:hypothetical protein GIB67_014416 [Kingdonia uniflora]
MKIVNRRNQTRYLNQPEGFPPSTLKLLLHEAQYTLAHDNTQFGEGVTFHERIIIIIAGIRAIRVAILSGLEATDRSRHNISDITNRIQRESGRKRNRRWWMDAVTTDTGASFSMRSVLERENGGWRSEGRCGSREEGGGWVVWEGERLQSREEQANQTKNNKAVVIQEEQMSKKNTERSDNRLANKHTYFEQSAQTKSRSPIIYIPGIEKPSNHIQQMERIVDSRWSVKLYRDYCHFALSSVSSSSSIVFRLILMRSTTLKRLADRKAERFQKNIAKRGAVTETTTKKGIDCPIGPIFLASLCLCHWIM